MSWHLDRTWSIGPLYLDLCGSLYQFEVGLIARFHRDGAMPWANSLSLYLGFICITVGYETE